MALWPFNRRKRNGSRSADAEAEAVNLGISTQITARDPKYTRRDARSTSKPHSRRPSRLRGGDIAPTTPETKEPREQSVTDKSVENGSHNEPENDRKPLAEVRNPVANPSTPSLKDPPNNASYTSLQRERFESQPITPTLQHKRSRGAPDAQRQKSSKRRAEDKDRLQSIKSMSAPVPVPKRPRSVTHGSSPLAPESGKIRSGLNRNIERPVSEVSLPRATSIRSSFSANLELSNSYRVIDALSPRPRIRYTDGGGQGNEPFTPSRASTKKEKGPAIPEEDFSTRKRIENLADDMDAGALRELMERDRRRKERKERKKSEKRQQAKADRHKERAERRKEDKGEGSSNAVKHSEDVQMRDAEDPSTREPPSSPPEPIPSSRSWEYNPSRESLVQKKPLEVKTDVGEEENKEPIVAAEIQEELQPDPPAHSSEPVELPADVPAELSASDSPPNFAALTPIPTSQKTTTEETKESPPSKARDVRRDSDGMSRWKSIFRRSNTKHRGSSEKSRGTPSEFSNTSRESFAQKQKQKEMEKVAAVAAAIGVTPTAPPPPPVIPREPKGRSDSGMPKRTRSKFREDLPEFVSPPMSMHSRVNSMDSPVSPISPLIESMVDLSEPQPPQSESGLIRTQSQRSGTPDGQSAALLSQSLASVDSEGSWLSGRPQKRSSLPISKHEGSDPISEPAGQPQGQSSSEQDAGYFARREPTRGLPKGLQASGLTAQLARGLQGADEMESAAVSIQQSPVDDQPKEGQVAGQKPTVVESAEAHRSREGLVEMYLASEDPTPRRDTEASLERPDSAEADTSSLHEATSVDLNKGHHSRRVSAGSARILEIPGRDREKRNSGLSTGGLSAASSVYSAGIPPRTNEEGDNDQARGSMDLESNKRHSAISVESAGNPSRTTDLGLGLRLGRRLMAEAERSRTPEPEKEKEDE